MLSAGDWINVAICIATLFGAGLALIEFWNHKTEARETRLQDREHELSKRLNVLEKERVDSLFAAMAAALKQLQEQMKEERKERSDFSNELRGHRSDLQSLQTVTKLEMDHIKASLVDVRQEVKTIVKEIGEGKVRVSGPKF